MDQNILGFTYCYRNNISKITWSCWSLNISGCGALRTSSASWAWLSIFTGVVALLHKNLLKISRALKESYKLSMRSISNISLETSEHYNIAEDSVPCYRGLNCLKLTTILHDTPGTHKKDFHTMERPKFGDSSYQNSGVSPEILHTPRELVTAKNTWRQKQGGNFLYKYQDGGGTREVPQNLLRGGIPFHPAKDELLHPGFTL